MSVSPPLLHTLPNGVRLLVLPLPQLQTVAASVFVRSGSLHEPARQAGISHAVEHMVFKGTATRDVRRINLDAERLGAEVNAHTDRDHTAFHMQGLAQHAGDFIRMLGDIVLAPTFPADELERERAVLLHEFSEDADDPLSTTFKLFDKGCWGAHAAARPVIGSRRYLERFTRDELARWVATHHTAERTLVAVAGPVDPDALLRQVQQVFGTMPAGPVPTLPAPAWVGGLHTRRLAGCSQTHVVLGFPIAPREADDVVAPLAAAVLGEGMSSPLLDQLREQRGLAYYAGCSADVVESVGQFVVELSTSPAQLAEALHELQGLLLQHAERVTPIDLARAHNQLAVRQLRALERPLRQLEDAALDVFAFGRVRSPLVQSERTRAVGRRAVQQAFAGMLAHGATLALAGSLPRTAAGQAHEAAARLLAA